MDTQEFDKTAELMELRLNRLLKITRDMKDKLIKERQQEIRQLTQQQLCA